MLVAAASWQIAQMVPPTAPGAPLFLRFDIVNAARKLAAPSNMLIVTRG